MKVNPTVNSGGGSSQKTTSLSENRGISEIKPTDFSKALSNVTEKSVSEDLQHLMQEIEKHAAKLAKSCTIQDLKGYKRSVREFLKETIGKAYQTHDEAGWDSLGKNKLYVLVKKVDEKLEELSYQVLQDQIDNLKILEKLDEIKGILIDLYL